MGAPLTFDDLMLTPEQHKAKVATAPLTFDDLMKTPEQRTAEEHPVLASPHKDDVPPMPLGALQADMYAFQQGTRRGDLVNGPGTSTIAAGAGAASEALRTLAMAPVLAGGVAKYSLPALAANALGIDYHPEDAPFAVAQKANEMADSLDNSAIVQAHTTAHSLGATGAALGSFFLLPEAKGAKVPGLVNGFLSRFADSPRLQAWLGQHAEQAAANLPRAFGSTAAPAIGNAASRVDHGLDPYTALALAAVETLGGTLGGVLPVSLPGKALVRAGSGLAMQQAVSKGQQAIEHAIAPDVVQAPDASVDLTDPSAWLGAGFGLLGGHGARGGNPHAGMSDDLLRATISNSNASKNVRMDAFDELMRRQPPSPAEIQAAQQAVRDDLAAKQAQTANPTQTATEPTQTATGGDAGVQAAEGQASATNATQGHVGGDVGDVFDALLRKPEDKPAEPAAEQPKDGQGQPAQKQRMVLRDGQWVPKDGSQPVADSATEVLNSRSESAPPSSSDSAPADPAATRAALVRARDAASDADKPLFDQMIAQHDAVHGVASERPEPEPPSASVGQLGLIGSHVNMIPDPSNGGMRSAVTHAIDSSSNLADVPPEDPKIRKTDWLGKLTTWATGHVFPPYQGNKAKMLPMVLTALHKHLSAATRAGITHIDDWFGGSGMYSTALAMADRGLGNVRNIRVFEYDPLRLAEIKNAHERGNKFIEDADESGALAAYRRIKDIVASEGKVSSTPIVDVINTLNGEGGALAHARAAEAGIHALSETAKMHLRTIANIALYGDKPHIENHLDELLNKVAQKQNAMFTQAKAFRDRGGSYEYHSGDSFANARNMGQVGSHVLSLVDPPYYDTKGYGTQGDLVTNGRWNANGYAKTAGLLHHLTGNGNHVLYTDEAWWRRPVTLNDTDAAGRILNNARSAMTHMQVAPEQVGGRYETIGIHDATKTSGRNGDTSIAGGDVRNAGENPADGRRIGQDSLRPGARVDGGVSEQGRSGYQPSARVASEAPSFQGGTRAQRAAPASPSGDSSQIKRAGKHIEDDYPRAQRAGGDSTGGRTLSTKEVHEIAAGVLGVHSDKLGVSRVHVVDSFEKLPDEVRKAAEAYGAKAGDFNGVHYKGHSYILADQMRTPADVEAAVFHEHYTHGGLRAKYGNALGNKLHDMLGRVGGVDGVLHLADKQHIDLSEYVKAKDPPHVLMEELMAHMSKTTGTLRRVVEEYVGAVRDFLRRKGFAHFAEMGVTDLAHVLKQARQAVREKAGLPSEKPMFQRVFHGTAHEAEVRNMVEHYAGTDGAPSEAQIRDAVQQFHDTAAAYGGEEAHARAKANGRTRLNYGQWVTVRTPNFKRWFGDWEKSANTSILHTVSKVVDPHTGEPLVVYHGTRGDFDAFNPTAGGSATLAKDARGAVFLTNKPDVADDFSGYMHVRQGDGVAKHYLGGANTMPVFVNLRTPDVWDMHGGSYREGFLENAIKQAHRDGRDGVIFRDMADGSVSTVGPWKRSHVVAVFRPEQIKSATGNVGTFDSGSADIRFSRRATGEDDSPRFSRPDRNAQAVELARHIANPDDTLAEHVSRFTGQHWTADDLVRHKDVLDRIMAHPQVQDAIKAPAPKAAPAEKTTGVKNEMVDKAREKRGAAPLETSKATSKEDRAHNAHDTLAADPYAGHRLVDRILDDGHVPNQAETDLLNLHLSRADNAHEAAVERVNTMRKDASPYDKAAAQFEVDSARHTLDQAERAADVSGTALSRSFSARKPVVTREGLFKQWEGFIRAKGGGDEVNARLRETIRNLTDQLHEIRQKMTDAMAQRAQGKVAGRKASTDRYAALKAKLLEITSRSKDDVPAFSRSAADSDVRFSRSGQDHLPSIIRQMARELASDGTTDAKAVIDRLHADVGEHTGLSREQVADIVSGRTQRNATRQRQLEKQIADKTDRIASGDTSTPQRKPKFEYDEKTLELQRQVNRLNRQLRQIANRQAERNHTLPVRMLGFLQRLKLFNILTSVTAFTKLPAAVAWRMTTQPVEEAVGSALRHLPVIGKVAAQAPRHGQGLNAAAELAAIKGFVRSPLAMKDAIGKGYDKLDDAFGTKYLHADDWSHWSGRLHLLMKEPAKQAEFNRAYILHSRFEFNRALAAAKEAGVANPEAAAQAHMDKPSTQNIIGMRSYENAMEAIAQGNNKFVDSFRSFQRTLESSGELGYAASKIMDFVQPILKVPSNILKEATSYIPVGGYTKALLQMRHGIQNMRPEDADYVMKNLKKATVGTGLMILGGLLQQAGVLHGLSEDDDRKRREEGGSGNVGGYTFGNNYFHAAQATLLQMGASIARHYEKAGGDANPVKSWTDAIMDTTKLYFVGDKHNYSALPVLDTVQRYKQAYDNAERYDHRGIGAIIGNELRSTLVPAFVQQQAAGNEKYNAGLAQIPALADPHTGIRHPRNVVDDVKVGIPGLREQVPTYRQPRQAQ